MHLAPIVLFAYNRPWHTRKTVEALQQNEFAGKSDLIIFSDGSKDTISQKQVAKVRHYIYNIENFKSVKIVERRKNLGLAKSVITGVTEIIETYGRAIVLEDDLLTSPYFLTYMNNALNTFKDELRVFSITGFNLSGNDRFNNLIAHMNGEIDSWAIRWNLTHHKHNAYCVYPLRSFVHNIVHDGTGIHCVHRKINIFKNNLMQTPYKVVFQEEFHVDNQLIRNYDRVCSKGLFHKLYKFCKIILNYTYWKN